MKLPYSLKYLVLCKYRFYLFCLSFLSSPEDWKFEVRLSKEFEAVGFFISDHPLNQFTSIFDDYKILDYSNFNTNDEIKDTNIAATLLKIQERKTAKGNSYAVLKLTDLTSVFELFIFSDILELNREILKEGNSLILTLAKSISNDENRFKRVNVQKIGSLKALFNSPINEVSFNVKTEKDINEISKNYIKGLKFHYVSEMNEVIQIALMKK